VPLSDIPADLKGIYVTLETQRRTFRTESRVPSDSPFAVALGPVSADAEVRAACAPVAQALTPPRKIVTLRVLAGAASSRYSVNECLAAGTCQTSVLIEAQRRRGACPVALTGGVTLTLVRARRRGARGGDRRARRCRCRRRPRPWRRWA
jgi:hypothetical protein